MVANGDLEPAYSSEVGSERIMHDTLGRQVPTMNDLCNV